MEPTPMTKIIVIFLILEIFFPLAPYASSPYSIEKINSTPDMMQTDPELNLPGGGKNYCLPVAVSNSFMWLAENGYQHLKPALQDRKQAQSKIARILGSAKYMKTSLKNGTGTSGALNGVDRYIQKRGYHFDRLEYQGWRKHPARFSTGKKVPDLKWIKEGIEGDAGVWLNVGWYRYNERTDQYRRIGGHWVTLVGYGMDEKGKNDPDVLIIHDPASRAGRFFAHEYVRVEEIESGELMGKKFGLPRSAVGYYKLKGGMHIKRKADYGILDGVVVLKMSVQGK